MPDEVDVLIAGGGAGGLSLAAHLRVVGPPGLRVMVVDDGRRPLAERAWAFWGRGPGLLDAAVTHRFRAVRVHLGGSDRLLRLRDYEYRVVDGPSLDRATRQIVGPLPGRPGPRGPVVGSAPPSAPATAAPGTWFVPGTVGQICEEPGAAAVVDVSGRPVRARWVLDGVRPLPTSHRPAGWLSFTGWQVRTRRDTFGPEPVLMDFRTPQGRDVRFVYVLPRGPREALVEHTCLTAAEPRGGTATRPRSCDLVAGGPREREPVGCPGGTGQEGRAGTRRPRGPRPHRPADTPGAGPSTEASEPVPAPTTALDDYLREVLGVAAGDRRVLGTEHGTLPLVTRPAPRRRSAHVLAVGAAAGLVRASTGYAYERIQRDSHAVARSLARFGHPFAVPTPSTRHRLLDAVLLRVLARDPEALEPAFARLFEGDCADGVLRFLDGDSTPWQEARIAARMPPGPFLRALLP